MMKFFRSARKNLSKKGNTKDYLIYAFGEIFLVMVGILLALQVNNWNQSRIERKTEAKALIDLLEEFKLNKSRIEEKQTLRIAVVSKLENYVNLLSKGEASYSDFQEFHFSQFVIGMTNPSSGVIDALTSSGDLRLISNSSLKHLLSDWKNQAGNLYENEEILWDVTISYTDYFQEFIVDSRYNWKDWDTKKLNDAFNLLQVKTLYRNKLVSYQGCNKIVVEECKLILESLDKIINLLEEEIKK